MAIELKFKALRKLIDELEMSVQEESKKKALTSTSEFQDPRKVLSEVPDPAKVVAETPASVLEGNTNNPANTDEKKKKLEEEYDFVDDAGKGWRLKENEGKEHLKWFAKGKKGEEPEFHK